MDLLILVTLGTQDKQFYRLLDAVQKQIDNKKIRDKVIVQAGFSSDYESKDMEIFDLIPIEEFEKIIEDCDLIITHGGVGTIINALKSNKKVIAAARLKKFGEHVNDHQLQIINNFTNSKYILNLENFDELDKVIEKSKKFKPKKYKSNVNKFINLIQEEIEIE